MEKNVSSVDIEELKKAREELNQERGIETDPNMYSNYNPNREEEISLTESDENESFEADNTAQSEQSDDGDISDILSTLGLSSSSENSEENDDDAFLANFFNNASNSENQNSQESSKTTDDELLATVSEKASVEEEAANNDSNSEEIEINVSADEEKTNNVSSVSSNVNSQNIDNDDSEKDFSVYDNFSAFEVGGSTSQQNSEQKDATSENIVNNEDTNLEAENKESLKDDAADSETNDSEADESDSTLDFDELFKLYENEENKQAESEPVENNKQSKTERVDEQAIDVLKENDSSAELVSSDLTKSDNIKETSSDLAENINIEKTSSDLTESDNVEETSSDLTKNSNVESTSFETKTESDAESTPADQSGIIIEDKNIYEMLSQGKLGDVLNQDESQKTAAKSPVSETAEKSEETNNFLPKINEFKFSSVISTNHFKDAGKLTFVLGKDEEQNSIYLNLKDSLNIAIFGDKTSTKTTQLSSILLSLMLKNNSSELNFIICDSSATDELKLFEKSDYMFFNRTANTQKEIFEALSELSNEIEDRYNKLATVEAQSIDSYNNMVDDFYKLPYLVVAYNDYSNISSNDYYSEINAMLYNVLKIGRLVGVYVVLTAEQVIDNLHVNYNLPTRMSFKVETKEDSVSNLGCVGAESLSVDDEFLWLSIADDRCVHIKSPLLSLEEIELIIEENEK